MRTPGISSDQPQIAWTEFTDEMDTKGDYYSDEIINICEQFQSKMINLSHFMVDDPYKAETTDCLPKIIRLFRLMHLSQLPVVSPANAKLKGIITR